MSFKQPGSQSLRAFGLHHDEDDHATPGTQIQSTQKRQQPSGDPMDHMRPPGSSADAGGSSAPSTSYDQLSSHSTGPSRHRGRGGRGHTHHPKFAAAAPLRGNVALGSSHAPHLPQTALAREAESLPVAKHRREILYLVERHATVVVVGETGSGKTTQLPQYLYRAGWAAGNHAIACTQPRRAAASSVANRVAEEVGCQLGELVGYGVRFDSMSTPGVTKIRYLTDGVLLREMMDDPLLTQYSVVMIDEAHERSLATDLLLGLLKKVQRQRPDLRLIIASATLEAEKLRAFFDTSTGGGGGGSGPSNGTTAAAASSSSSNGLPPLRSPAIVSIEGRTYPVQVHYLEAPVSDYVRAAVEAAIAIHKVDLPGDILVFLSGQEEVEGAVRMLEEEAHRLSASSGYGLKLLPMPLYAGLPASSQQRVFQTTPRGLRKVVVATNIAETSLTLEGVVYVVDSCFVKQKCYNPILGLESLLIAPISKASAVQRAGRAGRVRPGQCFRLITQEHYQALLPATSVPEMQRSDLTDMVLQLKALGVDNIMRFAWLSPPPAETMVRALETLHALGVLDSDAKLTLDIGVPLASLPLEARLGKCLLASTRLGCAEEMLTIAAMLSVQHIWASASGSYRASDEAKGKFAAVEGDLVAYLNVYRAWTRKGRSGHWSSSHFINHQAMHRAEEVRQQLAHSLRRYCLTAAVSSTATAATAATIAARSQKRPRDTGRNTGSGYGRAPGASSSDDSDEGNGDAGGGAGRRTVSTDQLPEIASCDGDMDVLRRAVVAGMFSNAAYFHEVKYNPLSSEGSIGIAVYRLVRHSGPLQLRIHPSSVLFKARPGWVVFHSAQQNSGGWYEMQGVTAVKPEWLTEVAPHMYQKRGLPQGMR